MSLPELFGVSGSSIRWERALLFFTAIVIGKVASFATGYAVSGSADAGFSWAWFNFGPPWELLLILAGQVAELVIIIAAFRFVRREYAALVLGVLIYGVLYTPVNLWLLTLALGPFQGSWVDMAMPRFATRVYYSLAFYGALWAALRLVRPLPAALLLGAIAGTVLGDVAAIFVQAATNPSSRAMTNFGFLLWGFPRTLMFALAFAGALTAGLGFSRALTDDTGRLVPRSFFTGSYLALSGAAAAILMLTGTLLELGSWRVQTRSLVVSDFLSGWNDPVVALNAFAWLLAIMAAAVCVMFVHRAWAAIERMQVNTPPGKAVALLFVPVFNLYWLCALPFRFRREYNAILERYAIPAKPLSTWLFGWALPIAVVLSSFAALVPFGVVFVLPGIAIAALLISRASDAVNSLPVTSGPEQLHDEGSASGVRGRFDGRRLAEEP
jgi:hypothetical protein